MDKGKPGPVISVVLPTSNRAEYLRGAINSVLAQTFCDFELIVVDDGSTDTTPQVLATVDDPRVQYIRLPGNCGPATARNVGICHAAGELIAFLDDDDAYYPEFLARVVQVMRRAGPEVGFCWCGVRDFEDTPEGERLVGERVRHIPSFSCRDAAYLYFWTATQPGVGFGLTVRRACFANVGLFDAQFWSAEDTDLLFRLVQIYDYVSIDEVLVKTRVHSGSRLSRSARNRALGVDSIYAKHAASLQAYPHLRAGWLTYSGALYFRSGQRARARQRMLQALAIAPWRLRTWRLWAAHEWHAWRGTWNSAIPA